MMNFEPCLVQTTTNTIENAKFIAKRLLTSHLAGCVQLEQISSIYHWQGEIAEDKETRLTIKTLRELFPTVEKEIKKHHPYDCPEILAFPIIEMTEDYKDWLNHCLNHQSH